MKSFWDFLEELEFSRLSYYLGAKSFWDFLEELELSRLNYQEQKVSGIFWRNLNFLTLAIGAKNFWDFLVELEQNYVGASTPKLGEWAERWDSCDPFLEVQ